MNLGRMFQMKRNWFWMTKLLCVSLKTDPYWTDCVY
jgi:hypothetical protein